MGAQEVPWHWSQKSYKYPHDLWRVTFAYSCLWSPLGASHQVCRGQFMFILVVTWSHGSIPSHFILFIRSVRIWAIFPYTQPKFQECWTHPQITPAQHFNYSISSMTQSGFPKYNAIFWGYFLLKGTKH
jgi:hypothetical protein